MKKRVKKGLEKNILDNQERWKFCWRNEKKVSQEEHADVQNDGKNIQENLGRRLGHTIQEFGYVKTAAKQHYSNHNKQFDLC